MVSFNNIADGLKNIIPGLNRDSEVEEEKQEKEDKPEGKKDDGDDDD